jgi:hypothetical protein
LIECGFFPDYAEKRPRGVNTLRPDSRLEIPTLRPLPLTGLKHPKSVDAHNSSGGSFAANAPVFIAEQRPE